jgi:hypothetical protein
MRWQIPTFEDHEFNRFRAIAADRKGVDPEITWDLPGYPGEYPG